MNDSERRKLEAFVRSSDFGTAHATDCAEGSHGKQSFIDIRAVIAEINSLAASETSGRGAARQGTTTRAQARDARIADLEAFSRTARVMSDEVPASKISFACRATITIRTC